MRILKIAKYYHPFRGGIETVQKTLAEGLVRAGHSVTVLAAAHTELPEFEDIGGVQVHRLLTLGSPASQPLTLSLRSQWAHRLAEHDVVHMHSPNPLAETVSLTLPNGRPVVTTYHSDIVRQKVLGALYRPVQMRFLSQIDRVIVPTEFHIKHSPALREVRNRCTVIPFGLSADTELKRIDEIAKEIKERFPDFFLFIGRMVSYKGVDVLLKAMTMTSSHVVFIGSGPLLEEWKRLALDLGVADRAHFLGSLEDDLEVRAFCHSCRALILPSITRAEMFGMVLLEAMSFGKPTVTTRLDSGVEFVAQNEVTGLSAEPGNAAELASCMNRLSKDDALCNRLGKAGLSRFHELFSAEKMVSSHVALYEKLIADRAADG